VNQLLQPVEVTQSGRGPDRKLSDLRRIVAKFKTGRRSPLSICESIIKNRVHDAATGRFFSGLPLDEKHYWIASLYALLMPEARRRALAAYFTPPHLVDYAIDLVVEAGIKPGVNKILDPSSGGAAFLVPLSTRIAKSARRRGASANAILETVETTLAGIEIDANLATLSRLLLADSLSAELRASGHRPVSNITRGDALKLDLAQNQFDAVIGNPPYGRIFRPSKKIQEKFAHIVGSGYVNLYSLFIARSLQWVRPGGIVCLVVPMSFIGGPHFAELRKFMLQQAHVLRIDPIDKRTDVFLDVMYDVCILVLQKKDGRRPVNSAVSSLVVLNERPRDLGRIDLPLFPSERVWALPNDDQSGCLFQEGLATLADYGYLTKTGYFVWNREKHRYRSGKDVRKGEVPLFWAQNVKPNRVCAPADVGGKGLTGFVTIDAANVAVIRCDAIILQRTSNRRQPRRLVAGIIRHKTVCGGRGFVTENHTILILPNPAKKQLISLSVLCRLLNTGAVDLRFRRMSGTVSVSTKALRALPLPDHSKLRESFAKGGTDEERAALAYAQSVAHENRQGRGIL
jgi:adenine-specific DNA-methyltransferase